MRRVKEILHTQYIGAIVVAILSAQGITGLISGVLTPLYAYLESQRPFRSVLDASPREFQFPWESLIGTLASVLLNLAFAFALFCWLFWRTPNEASPAAEDAAEADTNAESS